MDKYLGMMLDNRYELLELIGTGGMAYVYKARCHRLNRLVAVKILKDELAVDSDFRRRFETESQAVAMLSHPNIMGVYDVSRSGEVEYIVMELLEGITLKQYIQRKGVLNWKEALHFTSQICRALSHAHSRGIIHRDIKPHNIMILRDGSIKVADFGIARLTSAQSTLTQEALGSVHYISPEQAKGSHIDARSDIYSVGVVLYEMLTNRLPYEGDSPVAVAIQHINSMPLAPREINPAIPESLEAITMKAMAADMDKRYSSAEAMLSDLEEFRKNPNVAFEYKASDFSRELMESEPTILVSPAIAAMQSDVKSMVRVNKMNEVSERTQKKKELRNKNRSASRVSMLVGIFAVIVFIIAIFYFLYTYILGPIFEGTDDVTVPYIIGLDINYVLGSPLYEDYEIKVDRYVYDSDKLEGTILTQSPSDGRNVKVGQEILVTVSGGIQQIIVPNVVNKEYRTAMGELRDLGLDVDPVFEASGEVTSGYVISTDPAEGATLAGGDMVTIVVSTGPEIKMITMPNLSGSTRSQAIRDLENLNLSLGEVREENHESVQAGIVFDQSIQPGTQVPENFAVDIWVSLGPEEEEPSPPVTSDPVTSDPGTSDPGTSDPGTSDPGTSDPGTSDPVTSNPMEGFGV